MARDGPRAAAARVAAAAARVAGGARRARGAAIGVVKAHPAPQPARNVGRGLAGGAGAGRAARSALSLGPGAARAPRRAGRVRWGSGKSWRLRVGGGGRAAAPRVVEPRTCGGSRVTAACSAASLTAPSPAGVRSVLADMLAGGQRVDAATAAQWRAARHRAALLRPFTARVRSHACGAVGLPLVRATLQHAALCAVLLPAGGAGGTHGPRHAPRGAAAAGVAPARPRGCLARAGGRRAGLPGLPGWHGAIREEGGHTGTAQPALSACRALSPWPTAQRPFASRPRVRRRLATWRRRRPRC